jgi:hypothetical protein
VYVEIARGKLKKEPCATCGKAEVTAFILDPLRWREVVWICREDRREEITRRLSREPSHAEHAAWAKERDAVLAAVAALPENARERLYDIASRGPAGIRLASDAPLFVMQLTRAYRALPAEKNASAEFAFSPFAYALTAAMQAGEMLWKSFLSGAEAGFQAFNLVVPACFSGAHESWSDAIAKGRR